MSTQNMFKEDQKRKVIIFKKQLLSFKSHTLKRKILSDKFKQLAILTYIAGSLSSFYEDRITEALTCQQIMHYRHS